MRGHMRAKMVSDRTLSTTLKLLEVVEHPLGKAGCSGFDPQRRLATGNIRKGHGSGRVGRAGNTSTRVQVFPQWCPRSALHRTAEVPPVGDHHTTLSVLCDVAC